MPGFDRAFVASHLCFTPPIPTHKFTGQTIIVTGSNTGMGLEAARHFARLDASKVILAVRSLSKGDAAKSSIESTTERTGVIDVWELDLASFASVRAFADRVMTLERLDVVVANAGVYLFDFTLVEGNETTITVNVISTMMMALMILPKLRETAVKFDKDVVLTFTGSFTHAMTKFEERKAENILRGLADKDTAKMGTERYQVSKLIQHLLVTELADRLSQSTVDGSQRIITSLVNPGWVLTDIMRSSSSLFQTMNKVVGKIVARSPEEGGRVLVNAAEGGKDTHGKYLDDCKPGKVSEWTLSSDGINSRRKLWNELTDVLEAAQPGILVGLGDTLEVSENQVTISD